MPGGDAVYAGSLANQALDAVGARAMTFEGDMYVRDNFDPTGKAEDAALLAHEKTHMAGGGGFDHNKGDDEEEKLAQSVERMVLHRAKGGEDLGEILADIRSGLPTNQDKAEQQVRTAMRADKEGDERDQAMMAYWSMRARGYSPHAINQMLTDFVTETMMQIEEDQNFRTSEANKF
jgi:hypothetical protein